MVNHVHPGIVNIHTKHRRECGKGHDNLHHFVFYDAVSCLYKEWLVNRFGFP